MHIIITIVLIAIGNIQLAQQGVIEIEQEEIKAISTMIKEWEAKMDQDDPNELMATMLLNQCHLEHLEELFEKSRRNKKEQAPHKNELDGQKTDFETAPEIQEIKDQNREYCSGNKITVKNDDNDDAQLIEKLAHIYDKYGTQGIEAIKEVEQKEQLCVDGRCGTVVEVLMKAVADEQQQMPKSQKLRAFAQAYNFLHSLEAQMEPGSAKNVIQKVLDRRVVLPSDLIALGIELWHILAESIMERVDQLQHDGNDEETDQSRNKLVEHGNDIKSEAKQGHNEFGNGHNTGKRRRRRRQVDPRWKRLVVLLGVAMGAVYVLAIIIQTLIGTIDQVLRQQVVKIGLGFSLFYYLQRQPGFLADLV